MAHYRQQCEHGVLVSQCRCAHPRKRIEIVPCPPKCEAARKEHTAPPHPCPPGLRWTEIAPGIWDCVHPTTMNADNSAPSTLHPSHLTPPLSTTPSALSAPPPPHHPEPGTTHCPACHTEHSPAHCLWR